MPTGDDDVQDSDSLDTDSGEAALAETTPKTLDSWVVRGDIGGGGGVGGDGGGGVWQRSGTGGGCDWGLQGGRASRVIFEATVGTKNEVNPDGVRAIDGGDPCTDWEEEALVHENGVGMATPANGKNFEQGTARNPAGTASSVEGALTPSGGEAVSSADTTHQGTVVHRPDSSGDGHDGQLAIRQNSAAGSSDSSSSSENTSDVWDHEPDDGGKRPLTSGSAARRHGNGGGAGGGGESSPLATAGGGGGGRRRLFTRGGRREEDSSSEEESSPEEEVGASWSDGSALRS